MNTCAEENIRNFFKKCTVSTEIEFIKVKKYDYTNILDTLIYVVENNEEPVFDLTGGRELVLAAMGEVSARYNIPLIQYNVYDGRLVRVKNTAEISEPIRPRLDINGSVMLNGGAVVKPEEDDTVRNLTKGMKNDISKLWNICCENPQEWNRQTSTFSRLEMFTDENDKLRVTVNLSRYTKSDAETLFNPRVIERLIRYGLLSDFSKMKNLVTYRYKNQDVKKCILKAGNILELYTYMVACDIREANMEDIDDVDVSVCVDWDGEIHKKYSNVADIRNEIDVMLMRRLIPVFISCKNGEVHKEALYELDTVAKHYGGSIAKKILVATYVDNDENSRNFIIKRAQEMGITVIDSTDKMSREKFYERLEAAVMR